MVHQLYVCCPSHTNWYVPAILLRVVGPCFQCLDGTHFYFHRRFISQCLRNHLIYPTHGHFGTSLSNAHGLVVAVGHIWSSGEHLLGNLRLIFDSGK